MKMTYQAHGATVNLPALNAEWTSALEQIKSQFPAQYAVLEYGWKQWHADGYAQATNANEFSGKLLARHDKIVAGQMAVRDGGKKRSPIEREMAKLVGDKLADFVAERKRAGKPASKELQTFFVGRLMTTQGEEIRAQAERNLAAARNLKVDFGDILDAFESDAETEEESDDETETEE